MSNKRRTRKGFTLVELLVTIAILAVLATVSVVGYTSFIERAAVSNDEALVAQLNHFMFAYSIENDAIKNDNELSDMLYHTEMESITVQSEKYGYTIAFNTKDQKFELLKTLTNDHLKIPDKFEELQPNVPAPEDSESGSETPSPDVPTNPEGPVEPNPGEDGENNGDDSDNNSNVQQEVIFNINNDYRKEDDNFLAYVKSDILNIQIKITDNKIYNKVSIELNSIITASLNQNTALDITYYCSEHQVVTYQEYTPTNNYSLDEVEENITFYSPGTYTITCKTINNMEYKILVCVENTYLASASFGDTKPANSPTLSNQSIKLPIFDHLTITDYSMVEAVAGTKLEWKKLSEDTQNLIKNNTKIFINGKEVSYEIRTETISYKKYQFALINNLEESTEYFEYKIIYRYQGNNGLWVEKIETGILTK